MNKNITRVLPLLTDSYKLSHFLQYPEGTTDVFSYVESRGCDFSNESMFFGLQYLIKEYLSTPVTHDDVTFAAKFASVHGEPFNEDGWKYIVDRYGGYLPVEIRAVTEGTVMAVGNAQVTIHTNDMKCAWLPSYLETMILRGVWYPSSVATISFLAKRIIKRYLELTSDTPKEDLLFKLHDFGARGVSSHESAMLGGMAHLVNFMGTDTMEGILGAMQYYNADICGFSIPAAEHSTMTAYGRDGEEKAYQRMIDSYAKKGSLFAVVSDSYDIYNAVGNIWPKLLPQVKEKGATVVIRPDSGDPTVVPVEVIKLLMEKVGYTINNKGYAVLPPHVRIIQGDGMNLNTIEILLESLKKNKISATNIAFGMGGGLLQHVNRDTFKYAMKCSAAKINEEWFDVYKDPVTDKVKKSKKGLLTVVSYVRDNGTDEYFTIKADSPAGVAGDAMHIVYRNGPIEDAYVDFDYVREIAAGYL